MQGGRNWASLIAVAIGFMVAALAGVVLFRAGVPGIVIAQSQLVGMAYLIASAIAWQRRPDNATGPILIAIAYSWYISDFQSAPVPAVAGIAFATRPLVNVLMAYLLLAFPTGRLGQRSHRIVMGLIIAIVAIQMPSRLLLTDRVPANLIRVGQVSVPGCDCANPFVVVSAPEQLGQIQEVTAYLAVALMLALLVLVVLRLTGATAPMRRILWPVLFGAIAGLAVYAVNLLGATLKMDPAYVVKLSWFVSIARAAIPIGFLIGLLRMRMGKAAVADLVIGLRGQRTPESLERAIADSLHDPSVKLGYWSPAAVMYVDGSGKALAMPASGSGLSATFVKRADESLGAIIHDAVLDDDRPLLDAVAAAFALAVERDRLASTVHAQASQARQLPGGQVTLLYSDIESSTLLLDRLGERYADVLAEQRRILRTAVREHGGVEIDSRADEFFAAFAQAADPIGAALQIQRRLRDHAWPDGVSVQVRIGLHNGRPQMTDEGYVGLDVHRASRIGSAGHGGQILLSQTARERLEPRLPPDATVQRLGAFGLKGLSGQESLFQLNVSDLPASFPPLRLDAPARNAV